MEKWRRVRDVRRVVTGALELERAEKRIGSSLQAAPRIFTDADTAATFANLNAAELFITSGAVFDTGTGPDDAFHLEEVANVAIMPVLAHGKKCERCYQVLEDVGSVDIHPTICQRCADAVENYQPLDHG